MVSSLLRSPLYGALASLIAITSASAQGWQETLTGSTTTEYDRFGSSLAQGEGLFLVGCPRDDTTGATRGSGSVTIFAESPSGWVEDSLLIPPTHILDGNFGNSLSLDGARLLVGAPGEDSGAALATGRAHVYERVAGLWSLAATLEVSDLMPGDRFGYAVALDGEQLAVGAIGRDGEGWNSGCVFLFRSTATGWVESGRLFPPESSGGARFGQSLALSGDTLVVGAPEDNRPELASGAAYVFARDTRGAWSMRAELEPQGLGAFQRFGASLAISGSMVIVGAPGSYAPFADAMVLLPVGEPTPPRGAAFVFQEATTGWVETQRLRAPGGDRGDLFGQRVCIADGRLCVSAGGRPTGGGRRGLACLYESSGSGWFLTREISDPSPSGGQHFGAVAALAGDEVFVSGMMDHGLGTQAGCVQVFGVESTRHQSCFGEMCPCGNDDPLAGCSNSTGAGAELFALGSASISEDDLVVGVRGLPARTPVLVFHASSVGLAFFGDGILCVGGGSLTRTGRLGAVRRASEEGEARWGPGLLGTPGMAERMHLQAVYRDGQGLCGSGLNLSNALEFEVLP